MSLNNSNANVNTFKERNYKLCSVCKFKGKKGNPLVICTTCDQKVQTSNCCSHKNSNTAQYLCTTCKVKRKSFNAPTLINSARRTGQLNNIYSGRGSASHKTTPSNSTQHNTRRTLGSGSSPSVDNKKCINNTYSISSHIDLQNQIDKINSSLDEIKIICSNNINTINLLKQENQRLTELIYSIQSSQSTLSSELSPVFIRSSDSNSSINNRMPDNSIKKT